MFKPRDTILGSVVLVLSWGSLFHSVEIAVAKQPHVFISFWSLKQKGIYPMR